MDFHLAEGATLLASPAPADYNPADTVECLATARLSDLLDLCQPAK